VQNPQAMSALRAGLLLAMLAVPSAPAEACPVCNSDTGLQIRALAFGPDLARYLGATLAPVPLLVAAVIGAAYAGPWLLGRK
jgi:hypothetical protein